MTEELRPVRLDRLTRLAGLALDLPLALVLVGDDDRARCVASWGDDPALAGTMPFWVRLLRGSAPVVVDDASLDARLARHPAVVASPGIRFAAMLPVLGRSGRRVGAFCVADRRPRRLTPSEHAALVELGGWVQDEVQAAGALVGAVGETTAFHRTATALVVEDDPELRSVLCTLLGQDGVAVETAGDLAEAKVVVARRRPAVVLVDLGLPDGDGSELVRWMQTDDATAKVPVFVFTGSLDADRRRELESCNVVVNEKGRIDAAALSAAIASAVSAAVPVG